MNPVLKSCTRITNTLGMGDSLWNQRVAFPKIAFYLISTRGQVAELEPGRHYVCGRDQLADVVVPDSLISRRHAEICWDDDSFWSIRDLGSRNGTTVNGQRIDGLAQLLDHSQVQFGGQVYTLFMAPPGADVDQLRQEASRMGAEDTLEMDSRESEAVKTGFEGSVTVQGLPDLIQFFILTRRTGRLALSGMKIKQIWFVQGEVHDASFGDRMALGALIAMASDPTERFEFDEGAQPNSRKIMAPGEQILMDLALAMDNASHGVGDSIEGLGPQDAVHPTFDPNRSTDHLDRPDSGYFDEFSELDGIADEVPSPPGVIPLEATPMRSDATEATPSAGVLAIDPAANGIFAGRKFGNVALRCLLGHGCMAQVYRGVNEVLGSNVAVKVMLDRDNGGPRDKLNRKRFLREAQVAARIRHPNVVQALDAGQSDEGNPYMVMELVEGPSLGHLLNERGRISFIEMSRWAPGIAAGLGAIHAEGVVHRDLKPDNVMIAPDGTAKISDLGMAREDEDADVERLTGTGIVLGTPLYMAPEAVKDSHSVTPKADIYSFGVAVYQCLSGQPPFVGDTPYELMKAHLQGNYRPLNELCPDVDKGFIKLIHSCMDMDPKNRPDAVTLAQALGAYTRADATGDQALSHVKVGKGFKLAKKKKKKKDQKKTEKPARSANIPAPARAATPAPATAASGPSPTVKLAVIGTLGLLFVLVIVVAIVKL